MRGPVFVILSHGGVAPVEEAARLAAGTALSGPAGGVAAGVALAERGLGDDLITFDVGGTSTDIALVQEGEAALGRGRTVAGERIALESLDIVTLGAGGGSIGHVGASGTLQVGPRSAGAVPGPVAYGQGGTEPAVTDANLVLGYLDAANFLGGARKLDRDGALAAFERLGATLGIDAMATAEGVHRLANVRMADGIRVATVRRGVDPRDFTLLAFGGAAGLHASRGGARTRHAARRRAGLRRRAVGLGHAAHRLALRDGAQRDRHRRRAGRRHAAQHLGRAGSRKAAPASPPGSAARSRRSAPPTCAMASRSSRSPCRSRMWTGTRRA